VLLVLAIFVGIFVFINQDKLIDKFIERQASNAMQLDILNDTEDFRLITVGTSAPIPSDRAQTCNVIIANGKIFIFDLGEGSLEMLEDLRLPFVEATEVFISHWHSDHFIDLPGFINRSWQMGRSQPLTVYGPEGIDRIISGIDDMLATENSFRVAHHGPDIMNPAHAGATGVALSIDQGPQTVFSDGVVTISATLVNHDPVDLSYAYRIDVGDRSVVLSGDCSYDERLISFSQGADILVHEAMQKDFIARGSKLMKEIGNERNAKILDDILDYHSTPAEAATIAQQANVKKLILSHLVPVPENPISRRFFRRGLGDIFDGPIVLANDGDQYIVE
jgi:ribonuclease Z